MPSFSRRSFFTVLASAVPLAIISRRAHALAVAALTHSVPGRTLRALAEVVLPSELGARGIARVVDAFQRWIAEYREGAELTHGYGTSRLRVSGPTPATRWAAQLDALEASARSRHGRSFAELPPEHREALVRSALSGARLDRLPAIGESSHVALAVIAFFYDSAEATDLCYDARIGRQTCRPLQQSSQRPVALSMRPR